MKEQEIVEKLPSFIVSLGRAMDESGSIHGQQWEENFRKFFEIPEDVTPDKELGDYVSNNLYCIG